MMPSSSPQPRPPVAEESKANPPSPPPLFHHHEEASSLKSCRSFLERVKIVPHPSPTPSIKRGLVRLLVDQPLLSCLRADHQSLLKMLGLAWWGCCEGIKTLNLSKVKVQDEDALELGMALSSGTLRSLEVSPRLTMTKGEGLARLSDHHPPMSVMRLLQVLDLSGGQLALTPAGLDHIIRPLAEGGCPALVRLDLSDSLLGSGAERVATFLESPFGHELRDLNLGGVDLSSASGTSQGGGAMTTILKAMEAGNCPNIEKLRLFWCSLLPSDGQELGLTLQTGTFPEISLLDLSGNH